MPTSTFASGEIVRHYRLLERLGAGGMGIVYRAEDMRLGRTVALKFLAPELTREESAKQRFLVEAQAAARLDHPNICTVYEAGESEEGQLFIAMAFYEGETLDRLLARGPMPVQQAIAIAREVAEGLASAHAKGIVHRDVKPANVILTSSGGVKILDFGLAKLADVSMTRSRTALGTAGYMAPEQVRGDPASPATDVWGLGAMLFEMITGRRPFSGGAEHAVFYSILNDPAPMVRDLRPDAPPEIDAVIQRMLMKEPAARYASMREVVSDLSGPEEREIQQTAVRELRFTPGSMIAGRYRIVALLGEGGMGAVYRADDLKLGQKVALKHIPQQLTGDAAAYERICSEVRIGRQLSHPNICRVFDIVEAGPHRFIAMEYIEGEDLASLLRRIGRLAPDKALAVARDIASGLAAAHDRGIVHRDLKPANVMIDGEGRGRITDFGLAALTRDLRGEREFAGTPAYMAPEQLAGGEVSARSDIYALGLVMYELLTGRRMLDGATVPEIRSQQGSTRSKLTSTTREIDPAMQQIIARCTEPDPAARFPSVHTILGELPGGDALAAAIAAGETPSPAMVAAASAVGDLTASRAWWLLAAAVAGILACALGAQKTTLSGLVPNVRSKDALAVRAEEVTAALGHAPSRYVRYVAFVPNAPYLAEVAKTDGGNWDRLRKAPPSALRGIFRTSPVRFVPINREGSISPRDPPEVVPGMATIEFDHEGRLVSYRRVPEAGLPVAEVNWQRVFGQADLDQGRFREAAPEWVPPYGFDRRFAWIGTHEALPSTPLRVEAATLRGRVVFFRVIEPWARPEVVRPRRISGEDIFAVLVFLSCAFLIPVGRRNAARGRADIRGALRLAAFVWVVRFAGDMLAAQPVVFPFDVLILVLKLSGGAFFFAFLVGVGYLAIEPFIRRRWPGMLIGWSRLVDGRFRDPMVGREVLIGIAVGAAGIAMRPGLIVLFDRLGVRNAPPGNVLGSRSFDTATAVAAAFSNPLVLSIFFTIGWLGLLVLLRMMLRRDVAALVALGLLLVGPALPSGDPSIAAITIAFGFISMWVVYRVGALAMTVVTFVRLTILDAPLTLDFGAWYAGRSTVILLFFMAMAIWGFHAALGGKPAFGSMAEE